jgi:hypothetical protein
MPFPFLSGEILTADALNQSLPKFARKTADETVNNSATFQNDDHLALTVVASATYVFRHHWVFNSGATPDLKSQFTVPSGTTMAYWTQSSSSIHAASGLTEASSVIYDGDGSDITVWTVGYIVTSSTAGTVQWQWAQSTANASNTIVRKGSILEFVRVA